MNTLKKQASNLLTERIERKLLATCSITGIAITIEAPSILGYSLEYTNPIAEAKNFLKLAELPSIELTKLPPPILCGILLAILKHYERMDCPMSAEAQNLSLQSIHPTTIVDSIKFFSSLQSATSRNLSILPHLTLAPRDAEELQKSSPTNVLRNYRTVCSDILFPPANQVELTRIHKEVDAIHYNKIEGNNKRIAEAILRARRTKEATQLDLMRTGRKIIRELTEENILSPNLLNFLKLLFSKENLLTAGTDVKDRISKALLKHQNSKCLSLVKIINDNCSTNELNTIFKNPEDEEIEEELTGVEEKEEKKLTLLERIKLKAAGKNITPIRMDTKVPPIREQVEEELSQQQKIADYVPRDKTENSLKNIFYKVEAAMELTAIGAEENEF